MLAVFLPISKHCKEVSNQNKYAFEEVSVYVLVSGSIYLYEYNYLYLQLYI